MAASKVDALFTRVLEAHRDPARVTVTHSQQDRSFPVQVSSYDEPFFREVATVLSPDQVSGLILPDLVQRSLVDIAGGFLDVGFRR